MDTLAYLPLVYAKLSTYILVMTRIASLFATFNLFKQELINARIIAALTAILSVYVIMLQANNQVNVDVLSFAMFKMTLVQALIGFMAGLFLNIIFEIFVALGQIISSQIGLSIASLFDPRYGVETSLTQYFVMISTLIFLLINGHLVVITAIVNSFNTLPVTADLMPVHSFKSILAYSSIIFTGSVSVSLSIIIAILITNIALAVMTKFSPQFNLFSIGISLTLMIGLICLYMSYSQMINSAELFIRQGVTQFVILIHGLKAYVG